MSSSLRTSQPRRQFLSNLALTAALSAARWNGAAATASVPPTEYKTLAAALAGARPPADGGVAITVSSEYIKPAPAPTDEEPEPPLRPGAPIVRVAQRFGRLTRHFGSVIALAPPAMVRIYAKPGKPNIYEGMPQTDVLTLLLASLSNGQWQAVTGEQGLPVRGMATDDQRMLMAALLPHGKLTVAPYYYRFHPDYKPEDVRDLSDELPQGSLRISTSYGIVFPSAEKPNTYYQSSDIPPPPGGSPRYRVTMGPNYGGSRDEIFGATVRETVPNAEKKGQLSFSDPTLGKSIVLAGVKSVGGLFDQIRKVTGIEVYADPRYAVLSLTWIGGDSAAASARDLLRAAALCCTATYRRVGPSDGTTAAAYVLTDDIVGMGTRKSIWYEFEEDAAAARADPVRNAGQSLYTRFGSHSVAAFGSDAKLADTKAPSTETGKDDSNYEFGFEKQFAQLSPDQQSAVKRVVEQHNKAYETQLASTDGKIRIWPQIKLELLLPSMQAPLDMNLGIGNSSLFRVPKPEQDARAAARKADQQKQFESYLAAHPEAKERFAANPDTACLALRANYARRAVIVSPATPDEIAADVAVMQKLELNELWLDLPFNRQPTLSAETSKDGASQAQSAAAPSPEDLLAAAIKATAKSGIRVFPMIDIFAEDAPIGAVLSPAGAAQQGLARDRNLLGETSLAAETHVQERLALLGPDTGMLLSSQDGTRPSTGIYLNPLARGVLAGTESLVRRLAATTGIAGLVWTNTDPAGYDAVRGGSDLSRRLLGYNDAMRLAFLRIAHADPIDIYSPNYYSGIANTDVDVEHWESRITHDLNQKWKAYRRDQNIAFLQSLRAAAGDLPILVHQRRFGPIAHFVGGAEGYAPGWYGSWDNAESPLPTFRTQGDSDNLGPHDAEESSADLGRADVQSRRQSRSVLAVMSAGDLVSLRSQPPAAIPGLPKPVFRPDDGFVLDFREAYHGVPFAQSPVTARTLPELAAETP